MTIARANLVPAHHGEVVDPGGLAPRPGGGYSLTSAGDPSLGGPGVALDETGRPYRLEVDVTLPSGLAAGAEWVETLLDPEASTSDFPFVVDSEEHEPPVLRFRTGAVGLDPPGDGPVAARYEVGGRCDRKRAGERPARARAQRDRDDTRAQPDRSDRGRRPRAARRRPAGRARGVRGVAEARRDPCRLRRRSGRGSASSSAPSRAASGRARGR